MISAKRVNFSQRWPITLATAAKLKLIVEDRHHATTLPHDFTLHQPIDAARAGSQDGICGRSIPLGFCPGIRCATILNEFVELLIEPHPFGRRAERTNDFLFQRPQAAYIHRPGQQHH